MTIYGRQSPISTTFQQILSAIRFPTIITINRFNVFDRLSFLFYKLEPVEWHSRTRKLSPISIRTFSRFASYSPPNYHNLFISHLPFRCIYVYIKTKDIRKTTRATPILSNRSEKNAHTKPLIVFAARQPKHIAL